LIAENTISAIHLFYLRIFQILPSTSYPNFLISSRTSSLLNGQPFDLTDAFFLIFIAGSALILLSSMLKLFLCYHMLCLRVHFVYIIFTATASFTRGPNFFVSCTFPSLVILNDTLLSLTFRLQIYVVLQTPFSFHVSICLLYVITFL
jgi:hypothetical protein